MDCRSDWTKEEIRAIYNSPLLDLTFRAGSITRIYHPANQVQVCSLISIKTGGCPEDCKYCPQSARYQTNVSATPLMQEEEIIELAQKAIANGATRVCLGAAWRSVRESAQFDLVLKVVRQITDMGVEVCCTLGMLTESQAEKLKNAGLYAYNHNLDTSAEFYPSIITTRRYEDRLKTLDAVEKAGISVCCGGIIGMGESIEDRIGLIYMLARRNPHPESVPINLLIPVQGTPLQEQQSVPIWDMLRMIATARITMPKAMIRLSAGRLELPLQEQALCFLAGANSIFSGKKLLTRPNPDFEEDEKMLELFGLTQRPAFASATFLNARLQKRKEQGLLRSLPSTVGLIDLTSNDYFGFAQNCNRIEGCFHAGSTGSRLLTGNHPFYEQLEKRISQFHRAESCLIYNSGYTANLGLLSALGTKTATFLYDLEIHASMIDGMRLSEAKRLPFKHNDLHFLENRLKKAISPVFVLVESIYSLSGDFAPLQEIAALCAQYKANLIVDEAHATGIRGMNGEGAVVELGLESAVFARVHTFSKALGAHGACILGNKTLKDYLLNFSRPLIYTTALPKLALAAIESSYEKLLREVKTHQEHLNHLIAYFCEKARIRTSQSPIQPLYISDIKTLRSLSQQLKDKGLDVRAIVPPTASRGKECLRVVLHSFNCFEEIDQLLEVVL